MYPVMKNNISTSKKILFEGDGYSEEWHKEAESRGLPNLRTTPVALDAMITEKAKRLFESNRVYTPIELEARYEIELEKFNQIFSSFYDDQYLLQTIDSDTSILFQLFLKKQDIKLNE